MSTHHDLDRPSLEEMAAYPKESVIHIVLQFFVFPLLLVGVCVALFVSIRWLVGSPQTPSELLQQIRTGSTQNRWQAAYALARLSHFDTLAKEDPLFLQQLLKTCQETSDSPPPLQRYLVFILASIHDPTVTPFLSQALRGSDSLTSMSAMLAIAQNGRKEFDDILISLYPTVSAEQRKTIVYVLGILGNKQSLNILTHALQDPVLDVQWNAAIALARMGNDGGGSILLQLLDRSFLESLGQNPSARNKSPQSKILRALPPSLSQQDVEEILVNTLKAIFFLPNGKIFLESVSQLSQDPNWEVRALAEKFLSKTAP